MNILDKLNKGIKKNIEDIKKNKKTPEVIYEESKKEFIEEINEHVLSYKLNKTIFIINVFVLSMNNIYMEKLNKEIDKINMLEILKDKVFKYVLFSTNKIKKHYENIDINLISEKLIKLLKIANRNNIDLNDFCKDFNLSKEDENYIEKDFSSLLEMSKLQIKEN
ncbi:hypothetical protein N5U22_00840 [Aliarcobacter cryaerophilus]|uniref:hypothetical protein n=1 Tax=Aliarcobacter cryaerophilus TaxID=28198 RepID=UPI0021B63172|nr:hypothetical protein [Aliarcobacter cryaerophilus]MCT7531948.1 hypothetical protein [Aliarcobacter cryaerophilus]